MIHIWKHYFEELKQWQSDIIEEEEEKGTSHKLHKQKHWLNLINSQMCLHMIIEWYKPWKLIGQYRDAVNLPKKKTMQELAVNIKMSNPFMQLRKIVNHPYLVKWEVEEETGELSISLIINIYKYFLLCRRLRC